MFAGRPEKRWVWAVMSSAPFPLTTTAYAVLALLSAGQLSSRDLIAKFHARFGDVWPRTDALVYEQARRLGRLELVTVFGSGPTRACAITDLGREALAAWHATPPASPRIDVELAVRLASSEDLAPRRPDIARVGAWADERVVLLGQRAQLAGPAPGHALATDLLRGIYGSISEWADRSA